MPGVIAELRELMPPRPLTWTEAMTVAERQATRLLQLSGTTLPSVSEEIITSLPRISVERESPFKVAGATAWIDGLWMIALNGSDPETRQRFSLAHEFKHILDHPFRSYLYPPQLSEASRTQQEAVADHFAACLLMPRSGIRRAWFDGLQDVRLLARRFEVSPEAMRVRLISLELLRKADAYAAA